MPGGGAIGYGMAGLNDQGASTGSSLGTLLTASSSTNTKGSYAQLTASTPRDCIGFYLMLSKSSAGAGFLVDVAVGAAASEQVMVPNVLFGIAPGTGHAAMMIWCPIPVPAGSRISARVQSSVASATINAEVILADGGFNEDAGCAAPLNYGAVTGTSLGTVIDPGGSANTKGSYAQLTASTTYDIGALQLMVDNEAGADTTAMDLLVDIAIGAGGSEQVIIPNVPVQVAGPAMPGCVYPLFRVNIPAGTRIAARAQGTNTTSGTRKIGIAVLGYPK